MYLRRPDDTGLHSVNPSYEGPPDAMQQYRLNNGQEDEYPLSWALPVDEIRKALDYFKERNEPAPFIIWKEETA